MTRKIALLGSTGSIGRQSLEVIEALGHTVTALTANQNVKLLEEQCRRFRPRLAVCMDPDAAAGLKIKLADTAVEVASGMEGLLEAAALEDTDTVLTAVMGMVGLRPGGAGQQGDPGVRRGAGDGDRPPPRGRGGSCGFRALRYFSMPSGLPGPGGGTPIDPHRFRRAFFWQKAGRAGGCDSGPGPQPPQLVHGGQDHRGLGYHDEQGPGGHRGHAALPDAPGPNFRGHPPGEYHSLPCGIL